MSESSAMATFLAARKQPRRNIDRLMSIIKTVEACVWCSVRWTMKSCGAMGTGTFGPSQTIELKRVSFISSRNGSPYSYAFNSSEASVPLQPLHELHRLAHGQRVLAEEWIALAQLGGRHHRLHEAGQARQLEPERVVL